MFGTFHLLNVRGVPIRIHFTALLLIPMVQSGSGNVLFTLVFSVMILMSVALHELGHTAVAQRYGVIVQDIVLSPIGGVARLRKLPEDPHHEIRIALAGPYVSLGLSIVGGLLSYIFGNIGFKILMSYSIYFTVLNTLLLLFNLLPSFPMDGGRVLRGWLSLKKGPLEATRIAAGIGRYISIFFMIIGLLFRQYSLAIIGIFILISGGSEYRMMKMKNWKNIQWGEDPLRDVETDFVASPPPYAKNASPQKTRGLLNDCGVTLRDLYEEFFGNLIG